MRRFLYILLFPIAAIFSNYAVAQGGSAPAQAIEFTKRVHNFGKISVNEGAKHCSFEFRNISDKPVVISNILSSCGCTTPKWPKKPIMPGEGGKVEVTYLNDQGPYPFDKALTVYTSASTKPIILRITGLAYENERSVKEMFPTAIGPLGVKNNVIRGGQIAQGNAKSGNFKIANISGKSVKVEFAGASAGLELSIDPATIPGNGVADISYTIDTRKAKNWGNTTYTAYVVCNGTRAATPISIECMIIDNFSGISKEEKNRAAMLLAENSSYNFGTVRKGEKVKATFNLRNTGHSFLKYHKIEKKPEIEINSKTGLNPGEKSTLEAVLDTKNCSGEVIYTLTLITNSPNRLLVNLFITGTVE
ncbi:MAG: DUF1573 domain-containing protein [Bacteroidales bacterium]|nr:DUF1573 domain-containing protein [Bacteroidales bacterium]